MHTQLLQNLGFSGIEASVYMTLLQHPGSTIAEIAKYAQVHRPMVYKVLPQLIVKALVYKQNHGKRTVYLAHSPAVLQTIVDAHQRSLTQDLPRLLNLYTGSIAPSTIVTRHGKEGIKSVYHLLLTTCQKGETFYRYESPENYKLQDKYLPRAYFERVCKKKELQKFVITNKKTARQKQTQLERSIRVLPEKFKTFEFNVTQIIFQDIVAIVDFNSETAYIIRNPNHAAFQKELFRTLFFLLPSS